MASLPLLPLSDKPKLIGIARLASEGESLREGHHVEYFTLPAKSLLNRCVSNRQMPFTWTINPYRGCEFGCRYCYARYTHEFMEMRDGMEFEQKIYVKQHAAGLLRHDLRRVKADESIALGTATDPYQPAERRYEVTRGILEEFALHRGFELGIVTKSNLIVRDLELLKEVAKTNRLSVHITVTTLDTELARILEPRAPRPDLRIDAVRALSQAGLRVGVSCSPVVPGITDSPKDLEAVIRTAADGGSGLRFCEPAVSEAVLGGCILALPRTELSAPCRKLSQALPGSRVPSARLWQAAVAVGGASPREVQDDAGSPARAVRLRHEVAGRGIR